MAGHRKEDSRKRQPSVERIAFQVHLFPISIRRTAGFFQKLPVKIGEIAVTAAKSDIRNVIIRGGKRFTDSIQP